MKIEVPGGIKEYERLLDVVLNAPNPWDAGVIFNKDESRLILELIKSNKLEWSDRDMSKKDMISLTDLNPTSEGRIFLDGLVENRKKKNLFRNPYFWGILTGLFLNIASHILIKVIDTYVIVSDSTQEIRQEYHQTLNEPVEPKDSNKPVE